MQMMNEPHRRTPEQEAFERLFEEKKETLSEAARTVIRWAEAAAQVATMVRSYNFRPEDHDEAMDKMRRAADKLTDRDRKVLARLCRAARTASASIDPDDFGTLAGHRWYAWDIARYYGMASGMVEEILREKKPVELRKTAERELEEYLEDFPF